MDIYSLFNRPRDRDAQVQRKGMTISPKAAGEDGGGEPPPAGPQAPVGQFITVQSLTTFTGATGAISLIWGFVANLVPGLQTNELARNWVGFAIAAAVGVLIYWINTTDPAAPATPSQKRIGVVVAALNTLVLYSASFGTQRMLSGS